MTTRGGPGGTPAGRAVAAVTREAWRGVVAATDLLPPRWRYGHLRRATSSLLGGRSLPALGLGPVASSAAAVDEAAPSTAGIGAASALRCLLLTGGLDVGGVESVVATLAGGLPAEGLDALVVGTAGGRTADELRAVGVPVVLLDDDDAAERLAEILVTQAPEVVQLHNAPLPLVEVVARWGGPVVPVVHNMEIHRTAATWRALAALWRDAACTVAVSDVTARHHRAHLPGRADTVVIPNGASASLASRIPSRTDARERLGRVVGAVLDDDVVLLCLARYDPQKNIPGLVRAFLEAADVDRRLRLVVAGTPGDALEVRRADAVRRAGRSGDRVHLLGASDAAALLAAADVFVLDSFIEGWPVAATEAAAAGLPLVLADAGGAAELAAGRSGRALVVANAAGPAEEVDDRAVRSARRARRQPNEAELALALVTASAIPREATGRAFPPELSESTMVRRHADVLRRAAAVHGRPGGAG